MVRSPLHFHGRIPVPEVAPLTYRDGVTHLELVYELSQYLKNILHPSLQSTVDQVVADAEQLLSDANDQYVDGVQEFQRIHDAFMSDVNATLMALNDTAVSDLVDDSTSLLFRVLDREFTTRDRYEQVAVNAADFGATPNASDSTQGVQDAIDYAADNGLSRVIVNGVHNIRANIPGDYGRGGTYDGRGFRPGKYEGGIWLKSGITLDLRGGELRVIPNDSLRYSLLQITDVENVEILGGNLIGDRDDHGGSTGEWGAGIYTRNCRNVTLNGTKISEMWGDGISVTVGTHDLTIHNVHSDHNRRQGMSITGGRNIHTTNSTFTNTEGTLPMSGVDIEPNNDTDVCENITFRGCEFSDNEMYGLTAMGRSIKHVVVDGCTVSGNRVQTSENGQLRFTREPHHVIIRDTDVLNTTNPVGLELRGTNIVVDGCNIDGRMLVSNPQGKRSDIVVQNTVLHDNFHVVSSIDLQLKNNTIYTRTPTRNHLYNPVDSVILIDGNNFMETTEMPLRSSSPVSNAHLKVSNNVFQGYPDHAMQLRSGGSIEVRDNSFYGAGEASIRLLSNSENVFITGNYNAGDDALFNMTVGHNVYVANNMSLSVLSHHPNSRSTNTTIQLSYNQWNVDGETVNIGSEVV